MPVFEPTCVPFTYSRPVLPTFVTVTWTHAPVASAAEPLITCSLPLPFVVIPNRMTEPVVGARYM